MVQPRPGVIPKYRLQSFNRLEAWHLKKMGIRIPLHALEADPDEIVASVERFLPVWMVRD